MSRRFRLFLFGAVSCLAVLFPEVPPAAAQDAPISVQDAPNLAQDAQVTPSRPAPVRELTERRDAYSRHFLMSDGSVRAEISASPRFYEDDQGHWQPIDTRLSPSAAPGFALEATHNRVRVSLSGSAAGYHRVALGEQWVEFRPVGLGDNARLLRQGADPSSASLSDDSSPVDLRYRVLSQGGLKEDVVLASADAPRLYAFRVRAKGVHPQREESGAVRFLSDGDDDPVFEMPAPFAVEAGGRRTDGVAVELVDLGDTFLLTYALPADWTDSAAYPVTLDPTIVYSNPIGAEGKDTWIDSHSPTLNHGTESTLTIGTSGASIVNAAAFIQFPLSVIPAGSDITDASLSLWTETSDGNTAKTMTGYACDRRWGETTLVNDANRPGRIGTGFGSSTATITAAAFQRYDYHPASTALADQVERWYDGTDPNYGMELVLTSANWMKPYAADSSDAGHTPYLYVTYNPGSFTKDPYAAGAPDAWEAGEGVTPWQTANLRTGNVLTEIPVTGFDSRGFPVGLAFYHNSMDPDTTSVGLGWGSTYTQTVSVDPLNSNNRVYRAADGSRVLFTPNGANTWDGSPGFPLRLTKSGTIYTLTDPSYSTETFQEMTVGGVTRAYLSGMRSPLGTTGLNVTLDGATGRPQEVTELAGTVQRKIAFGYNATTGRLESVTAPGTTAGAVRTWSVSVASNNRLTSLTLPEKAAGANRNRFVFVYSGDNAITRIGDPDHNTSTGQTYLYWLDYGKDLRLTNVRGRDNAGGIDPSEEWISYAAGPNANEQTATVADQD